MNTDHLSTTDELLDDLDGYKNLLTSPEYDLTIETEVRAEQRIEELKSELRSRGVEVED